MTRLPDRTQSAHLARAASRQHARRDRRRAAVLAAMVATCGLALLPKQPPYLLQQWGHISSLYLALTFTVVLGAIAWAMSAPRRVPAKVNRTSTQALVKRRAA